MSKHVGWYAYFVVSRYGRENGYPHLEHATLPRYGAVKAIMEEVGPKKGYNYTDDATTSENGSKLKLIRDTVGAIREKKYIKGLLSAFSHSVFYKFPRLVVT